MSQITVDLATLDDDQLAAMSLVLPEAVAAERARRFRFASPAEALATFERTHLHLAAVLAGYKGTPAVRAIQETDILRTGQRLLETLRSEFTWEKPSEIPLVTPKRRTMS